MLTERGAHRTLATTAAHELAPVCAVVGGVLAQDILKALAAREPPIARRDIMRWRRPERFLLDSKEITLAFIAGLKDGSSGGPASRKAMRSCAALEMCGFPPGPRGEVGVEGTEAVGCLR